ncbi:MAG: Flavoredoxin [candidate division BRC1 bacterium ADurb.BinA364]|nr:MAG: Flavoredoxin [candidate division BRC1 bacterium ADurb.BinA364]
MAKVSIPPFRPVHPSPAALITCADADGKPNIITLAEVFNISLRNPVIVAVAVRPATYSHGLISATREYTINLPPTSLTWAMDRCGTTSGRDGLDKFSAYGLTPLPAKQVKAPLIAECPLNIECRVTDIQRIGDHDLFVAEACEVHVDEDKLNPDGSLNAEKLDLIMYVAHEYWSIGRYLGRHGYTKRK